MISYFVSFISSDILKLNHKLLFLSKILMAYPSDMLKFNSFISTKYEIDSITLI